MASSAAVFEVVVERLCGGDLVAVAQCIAIDVEAFPHPSARFALRPEASPVWVARRAGDGRVLGFLAAVLQPAGDLYVEGFAVAEPAKRHGAGRALVRAALAFARETGAETLSLHVWTGNRAAIALYRSEGFDYQLRKEGYYRPGTFAGGDAYRMVHVLH